MSAQDCRGRCLSLLWHLQGTRQANTKPMQTIGYSGAYCQHIGQQVLSCIGWQMLCQLVSEAAAKIPDDCALIGTEGSVTRHSA